MHHVAKACSERVEADLYERDLLNQLAFFDLAAYLKARTFLRGNPSQREGGRALAAELRENKTPPG